MAQHSSGIITWSYEPFIDNMPGFLSGRWYHNGGVISLGGANAANLITATPIYIPETVTVVQLAMVVGTLSAGQNCQAAIYSATIPDIDLKFVPKLLMCNTPDMSTAAAGNVNVAPTQGNTVLTKGWYFACSNKSDAIAALNGYGAGMSWIGRVLGGSNVTNTLSTTATISGLSTSQTYGTWPADLSAATWADQVKCAAVAIQIF